MKKKITLLLLALACALCLALGLAACGGGGNKLKVSAAQFDDAGISAISVYTANSDVMEKDENDENDNPYMYFQNKGNCFDTYSGFNAVEMEKGTYAGVVSVRIKESHTVLGSWMNNNLQLKLKINGTECELMPTKLMGSNMPFSGDYWTLVGDDGIFSDDLTIELVGNTVIKSYKPTVTLNNYEDYKDDERCQGLKFKAEVAQRSQQTGELSSYVPFEYNSKTEFSVTEFKDAMQNSSFTYFDEVKVSAYFENKAKFFPNSECAQVFCGDKGLVSGELEIEWTMSYALTDWHDITLNFAGLDEEKMSYIDEYGGTAYRAMTLDDMTKVKLERGMTGDMFKTMFQSENVKFIVDGTEKDQLTLEDYYKANNVKIKSIVSELGAKILQDENMIVVTGNHPTVSELENQKRLTQSEIIIGGAVDGKAGYKEVTLDIGNFKAFKVLQYGIYTTLELNVFVTEPAEGDSYYIHYYTDSLLESLQKFDFEDASTGGITVWDTYYENKWEYYKSANDRENQIAIYYWESGVEYNTGCYYTGDELAICLGASGGIHGSDYVSTLELTVSIEGETDRVITLNGDGWHEWYLNGTYEGITCEVIQTDGGGTETLLVIKSSKVTKISGKVTVEEKPNQYD